MLRTALTALALCFAAPALAGASLDAQVLLVEPNHSGTLPDELRGMRKALATKGYSGARVAQRRQVVLQQGTPVHVDLGRREVDLTLLGVQGDTARVSVQRNGRGKPAVTTVPVKDARFLVTAPR